MRTAEMLEKPFFDKLFHYLNVSSCSLAQVRWTTKVQAVLGDASLLQLIPAHASIDYRRLSGPI